MSKKKQTRIPSSETIEKRVIKYMSELGTYKKEFSDMIKIYADLIRQYEQAKKKFIDEGELYEVPTAANGTKKSGTVSAMETLRKDIGTYSDRLMLNPKALDKVQPKAKEDNVLGTIFDIYEK